MLGDKRTELDEEFTVSFGYQCQLPKDNLIQASDRRKDSQTDTYLECSKIPRRSGSFSCLSGAALSANATSGNTNLCNGLIGAEILPGLDSPKSFRRITSMPSFSRWDILSSTLQTNVSLSNPLSPHNDLLERETTKLKSMSAPSRSEGFFNEMEVQMAGGAAGEDRVQTICCEENELLFCAVYDGFNGRDAADFLAGTLYENLRFCLSQLDWTNKQGIDIDSDPNLDFPIDNSLGERLSSEINKSIVSDNEIPLDSFKNGVIHSLRHALAQAESDFLSMVEQEMDDRPDLVAIGSCVLVLLLIGKDLYILNLGDSKAVLASTQGIMEEPQAVKAIQLTCSHSVDNETERALLLINHPNDPSTISFGRVKGKLKLTRAFGVGYLKRTEMNDALLGILRVPNLLSPPYISNQPFLNVRRVSESDHFVIVASDGLFDFFSNDEAVKLVYSIICNSHFGDPAKFLLEHLISRAAQSAGFSVDELMRIPAGRRRKYHDDVTVIVIILGSNQRTCTASTYM
ncbi:probable protein phosphatase 2C 40 [Aristolochia californica]|uniref:probable protein phosphatase 2C 40 n=1 Tax=Aristolochia californica TaxID=171875 RepID=UPI0035E2C633